MLANTLLLRNGEGSEEVEVLKFDYIGQVNKFYEIEFRCVGNLNTISLTNARFEFSYGSRQFPYGNIYGYVKDIQKSWDNEQARSLYIIKGISVVGLFSDFYLKKSYSDTSTKSIIADLLSFLPNTRESYQDDCRQLLSQQNCNQLLESCVLDFFNYQFNLFGFYIVKDSANGDSVNIYSHPRYINDLAGRYDLTIKDYGKVILESFCRVKKNHRQSVNIKGYDIDDSDKRHYPDNQALSGSVEHTEHSFYDRSYKSIDREELSRRKNASYHSLDELVELSITNTIYREGDLLELSGDKYWVYSCEITASLNEDKHWVSSCLLKLLPVIDNQIWYAPEVARPIPRVIEGFSYDSKRNLDKYSSLPLVNEEPFSSQKDAGKGAARQVVLSSSKEGGHYSNFKKSTRLLVATSDNNDQDRVALGHTSTVRADELVKSSNFEDNGVISAGGVGLAIRRNRAGNDYSKVSLYSQDYKKRLSELSLGGFRTTIEDDDFIREFYKTDRVNLEGIVERSVSNNLDIASSAYRHNISDLSNITVAEDDKNTYTSEELASNYLYRYYAKSFAESSGNSADRDNNYVTKFNINTDKRDDKLDTSVSWELAKESSVTIDVDGSNYDCETTKYRFNHDDTKYSLKLDLGKGNQLVCECDIDESLKKLEITLEPASKAYQYQCTVGWELILASKTATSSISVSGQNVPDGVSTVYLDLSDSSKLSLEFDISGGAKSTVSLKPCSLNRTNVDNKDLPRGDLIIQSDDGSILEESTLGEQRLYTGVLLESNPNKEIAALTSHDIYTPSNYSVRNQRNFALNYDAKKALDGYSSYSDSMAKAEDSKVEGRYMRKHDGDLTYTQKEELEKKYEVEKFTGNISVQNDLDIEYETINIKEQAKVKSSVLMQGDVTYSSDVAMRNYKYLVIGDLDDEQDPNSKK